MHNLGGEVRHADWDGRPAAKEGERLSASLGHLIVYPCRRRWARAREPVDGNPLEN